MNSDPFGTASLDSALGRDGAASGGSLIASTTLREPEQFLARVRRRRWARRARAGAALTAVVMVAAGVWVVTRGATPARPGNTSPDFVATISGPDIATILAAKDRPAGSGLQFTLVAHAGSRPGGDVWRALLED